MLTHTLPRFGITTTWVDHDDLDGWRSAVTPDTRLFLTETLGNPRGQVTDLPAVCEIAHAVGVPVLVDNTFATPFLFRPFDHGADLVYHSATKFIGGHGIAIGGVVIDGGRFPWERWAAMYPTLTEPYAGYHGLDFGEEYGPDAFIARARAEGMRDFGASLAPQNAFYFLQGLETLSIRMERHVSNALRVAEFLESADGVTWVSHPGLPSHPDHEVAQRLLPKGSGAIFSFGVAGGRAAGRKLIESVGLWSHLANVGDAKSLIIHPASTTHQQMNVEELEAAGVGEDLIRISVGLEDINDLLFDLGRALRASQR
jgi:O-acetylhomoserine (thiol)-lyase